MPKNRIAMLRKEHGMNQKELGEKLGVGQTTVSAWETGKNEPDNASLNTMAKLFFVSIGYLTGYENDERTRGMTQEQILEMLAEKERQKEIERINKEIQQEARGDLTDEDLEELLHDTLIDGWNRDDPNHAMYFQTYQFNKMCEDMSEVQRQSMLEAAQAVFKAVHEK